MKRGSIVDYLNYRNTQKDRFGDTDIRMACDFVSYAGKKPVSLEDMKSAAMGNPPKFMNFLDRMCTGLVNVLDIKTETVMENFMKLPQGVLVTKFY